MFDIGGWEFLVIVVVALVVIGPKDLPAAVRAVSAWMGKARELAREFRGGLDELQREVELDGIEKEIKASIGADEMSQTAHSIRNEIEDAGRDTRKTTADPARDVRDEWDEAYTYFQDPPAAPDAVEEDALHRLRAAEAAEREAAAAAGEKSPESPPAPAAGSRAGA